MESRNKLLLSMTEEITYPLRPKDCYKPIESWIVSNKGCIKLFARRDGVTKTLCEGNIFTKYISGDTNLAPLTHSIGTLGVFLNQKGIDLFNESSVVATKDDKTNYE